MKRNLIGTLTLVVLSLLSSATGAYAQTAVKGDVPFSFMAVNTELTAGRYAISANGQDAIYITNLDTGKSVISLIRSESPKNTSPKLVFHHLGGQYFLAEAWAANGSAGMVVPRSALEKELRIANGSKSNVGEVVIALK